MQLLKGKQQLRSTIGPDSGFSSTGIVDVEVPKQYKISRSIKNCSRNKGINFVSVN